jgi:hypothetical protein
MARIRLVAIAALCVPVAAANALDEKGAEQERAAVEKTIRASIGWALAKDRSLLESVIARDAGLFIFHPDSKSTVAGWDAFARLFDVWMDPRFKATRFDERSLKEGGFVLQTGP